MGPSTTPSATRTSCSPASSAPSRCRSSRCCAKPSTRTRGLAAAIEDGLHAFWQHVVSDDGLQLMQYELTIFCRRTEGFEWLAEWQYTRYASAALEVFQAAADQEPEPLDDRHDRPDQLPGRRDGRPGHPVRGHPRRAVQRDLDNIIRAAHLLVGLALN